MAQQEGRVRGSTRDARKYLVIGNSFGRHSNQMVVVAAGIALARRTGRVLVLPDLAYGGGKGGGGSTLVPVGSVYRLTPDTVEDDGGVLCVDGGGCVTSATGFRDAIGGAKAMAVACVGMRGVSGAPKGPRGAPRLDCDSPASEGNATSFVRRKKQLGEVLRVMSNLKAAAVVYVPLVMYVGSALEPASSKAWRLFAPAPAIANAVHAIAARRREKGPYTAVHLRSLEGSCASRVRQYVADDMCFVSKATYDGGGGGCDPGRLRRDERADDEAGGSKSGPRIAVATKAEASAAIQKQCAMEPGYIRGFMPPGDGAWCFLADDGQQPKVIEGLKNALGDAGVIRGAEVVKGDANVASAVKQVHARPRDSSIRGDADAPDALPAAASASGPMSAALGVAAPATAKAIVNTAAFGVPGTFFADAGAKDAVPAALMQVDFWAMAAADVFVGNQLSTLSVNVCRRRRAVGLPCDNFVRATGPSPEDG